MPACRYMEDNSLAAMLASKRSAGVAPEVNLRECISHICLHQVQIRLPTLVLKPRGDVSRSPKQGYQWPHKKDLCPAIFFKKKLNNIAVSSIIPLSVGNI